MKSNNRSLKILSTLYLWILESLKYIALPRYSSLLLLILILLNTSNVFGAKMTNDDVIKLVEAGMSEELIISVIAKSETSFDTSTGDVIALSKKGVSQKIISAMITTPKKETKTTVKDKEQADANNLKPGEIILLYNGQEKSMKYIIPEIRSGLRALGYGGMATYAVMRGAQAQLRIADKTPSFLVSVPTNLQPDSYISLANFIVRKNRTREVLMGGGYLSYSTGITPDRIIPVAFEKIEDQSRATKDFVIYKLTPQNSLIQGEYAVVLNTSEVRSGGFFGHGSSNVCFDFGID